MLKFFLRESIALISRIEERQRKFNERVEQEEHEALKAVLASYEQIDAEKNKQNQIEETEKEEDVVEESGPKNTKKAKQSPESPGNSYLYSI